MVVVICRNNLQPHHKRIFMMGLLVALLLSDDCQNISHEAREVPVLQSLNQTVNRPDWNSIRVIFTDDMHLLQTLGSTRSLYGSMIYKCHWCARDKSTCWWTHQQTLSRQHRQWSRFRLAQLDHYTNLPLFAVIFYLLDNHVILNNTCDDQRRSVTTAACQIGRWRC